MFAREIANDPDPQGSFTSYHKALEVRIYKHSDALEGDGEKGLFHSGQE